MSGQTLDRTGWNNPVGRDLQKSSTPNASRTDRSNTLEMGYTKNAQAYFCEQKRHLPNWFSKEVTVYMSKDESVQIFQQLPKKHLRNQGTRGTRTGFPPNNLDQQTVNSMQVQKGPLKTVWVKTALCIRCCAIQACGHKTGLLKSVSFTNNMLMSLSIPNR